jgi:hypothetical protein
MRIQKPAQVFCVVHANLARGEPFNRQGADIMFITPAISNGKQPMPRHKKGHSELMAYEWRNLFVTHSEALSSVARILTEEPVSPKVVLFNAESKISDRDIPDEFKYRYAIHTVVLAALVMPSLKDCPDGFQLCDCTSAELADFEVRMVNLPRRERCVVFLRDALGYSLRETGLLLSVGDSQVDDLLDSARTLLLLQGRVAFEGVRRYFNPRSSLAHDYITHGAYLGYV